MVKGDTYRSYALFVKGNFDVEILEIIIRWRLVHTISTFLLMDRLTPGTIHLVILLSICSLLSCTLSSSLILHLHHLHSLHLLLLLSCILHLHTLLLLLILLGLHLLLALSVLPISLLLIELLLAILIIVALLLINCTIGILCAHVRTSGSLDRSY